MFQVSGVVGVGGVLEIVGGVIVVVVVEGDEVVDPGFEMLVAGSVVVVIVVGVDEVVDPGVKVVGDRGEDAVDA